MRLTGKTRRQLLLQNIVYCALLVALFALLGWAGTRYSAQFDWSAGGRNTVSQASREVVEQLDKPVTISVFIADNDPSADAVRDWLERYRRINKRIELVFVDPRANPGKTRQMDVTRRGEILVEYDGRRERLEQFNERHLTNALQRLARGGQRWVVYTTGHGERDPYGDADHGLGTFTERLSQKGFRVQSLNLANHGVIPDNTRVLVIASPARDYLPGEVRLIREYLADGGNLLWLAEPEGPAGLAPLADQMGLEKRPGTVVDPSYEMYGADRPGYALVVNYPDTEVMPAADAFTLFPHAAAWTHHDDNPLNLAATSLLKTRPPSWTETGTLEEAEFNAGGDEIKGPLDIGYTLRRELGNDDGGNAGRTQRIAVIGDGDFLSNAFIDTGANARLGANLMDWLSGDDDLIDIEPVTAPDTQLKISERYFFTIALAFVLVIPGALIAAGIMIRLRRRRA
jgi:ABC-type uncharacterized transport system involved in gliding motility auxiliary subunit